MSNWCVGVYVAVLLLLCSPFVVSAHATPLAYTPQASATELITPASISVRFTERIEVGASSLTVYGPDGVKVSTTKGEVDSSDSRVLQVGLTDAGEGVYTVSWQVVSVDDGHFTKGAYSFLVSADGQAFNGVETVAVSYSTNIPDVITSFLNLVGESVFVALCVFLLAGLYLRRTLLTKHVAMISLAAGFTLFVSGSVIYLVRKSIELATLQDISVVHALFVYITSSVGEITLLKLGLAFCVAALLYYSFTRTTTKRIYVFSSLAFVFLALLLYMQAMVSHSAASLFLPHVSVVITWVHLFAKECIVGGVLVLCVAYCATPKTFSSRTYYNLIRVFDIVSSSALFWALISGVYVVWLHLKHVQNVFTTSWGELFISLVLCTGVVGIIRLGHQFVIHPGLHQKKCAQVYAVTLPFEAFCVLCVLFFSAYISMTTPPFAVESYGFIQEKESENILVTLQVHPYETQMFSLLFTDTETKEFVDLSALTVTAENSLLGVGPNVLSVYKRSSGSYVFSALDFTPHGAWQLTAIAEHEGGYDAYTRFDLSYPQDILENLKSDEQRHFDSFAQSMILISFMLGLLSLIHIGISVYMWKAQLVSVEPTPYVLTPLRASGLLCLCALMLCLLWVAPFSSFKSICTQDGNKWTMSYPTRDFEATSKNAYIGCSVHGGHYHFANEQEYRYFRLTQ